MVRPTAAELLTAIESGKTLYIQTATRITPINARTVAAFSRAGMPVLKDGKDGHLYMAQGRRYVDCHYAALTIR
jgi:hypothetical protein